MFTIIGGDGKEYGPATADQIRAWIAAGRANLDTQARALGSEEWRRLGDFIEFSGAPGTPPPAVPPLPAAGAGVPAQPVNTAELADRGRRLGARAIDWAIEFLAAIPGGMILGAEAIKILVMAGRGEEPNFDELDMQRLALGGMVLLGAWLTLLVVQVWLLSTRGQSIGKLLVGVRVVRFADGGKAGFVNAWLLRECVVSIIGIVAGLIPFIGPVLLRPGFHLTDWCFIFRADQRCLHDLLAGTKVVKA